MPLKQLLAATAALLLASSAASPSVALAASRGSARDVPKGAARGASTKTHIVGKGDTLVRIAKRYRVGVDALREANDLKPHELLHPGLSLTIPSRDGSPSRAAPAGAPARDPERVERVETGAKAGKAAKAGRGKKEKEAPAQVEPEAQGSKRQFRGPRRRGYVRFVRGNETIEIQLATRHGRLAPNALASFSHMLRSSSGAKLAMDPRLASLVSDVSEHFNGRPLHIVSGFRPYSPVQYTAHSNHNLGRAMDFAVEGVANTALRDYCRGFRDAGVGFYPNSTFVHLDVRTGKAYWIDYARPGEAPRYDASTPHPKGEPSEEAEAHTGVGGEVEPE